MCVPTNSIPGLIFVPYIMADVDTTIGISNDGNPAPTKTIKTRYGTNRRWPWLVGIGDEERKLYNSTKEL